MRHRAFIAFIALSQLGGSGCWFEKKIPPAVMDKHLGGSFQIPSCGYPVTTRQGASAPVLGTPKLGASAAPQKLHLGLAGDPTTSMVVAWSTDEDTLASTIQFGTSGAADQTFEGVTFVYDVPTAPSVRMHEAYLCGLKPGTVYSYRVGGTDMATNTQSFSDTYTFHTAPADPNEQIVAVVLGDTRDGYTTWAASLQQAFAIAQPDVVLFSGDAVTLGPVQPEWDQWFTLAEAYLRQAPLLPAHGNHDVNAINYYSQLPAPGNQENYGIDYGAMHLTVVNDTPVDPSVLPAATAQFLDADLKASTADWRLVMHHRPLWSSCSGHGGDTMLQAQWGPIFDADHPDLVLNGHDHDYERTKPMKANTPQMTPADGTVYVVAGSAGAVLYDSGNAFYTQISEKTNSFVVLHIRKGMLKYDAYRSDGSALDSFMISK